MVHEIHSMGSSLDYHFLSMVVVRGLWLLPLIFITGVIGFRLFVFNPLSDLLGENSREKKMKLQVGLWTRRWISVLLIFFSVMTLAALFHETMMITGKPLSDIFPNLLTVLEKTHWGRVWVDRFLILITLGMFWGSCLKRNNVPFRWFFILSVLLLGTFTLIGHPADKGDLTWRVLMDSIHLVAISLWIGGLFPLFRLLLMMKSWDFSETTPFLVKTVERFSLLAVCSVLLMVSTGIFAVWNSWGQIPTKALLLDSNYGYFLSTKLVFVLGVLAFGGLSRFYILPGLRKSQTGSPARLRRLFKIFLIIELILAAGVLVFAFLLTQTAPPASPL
jgi:putative copper resistance protein D